VQSTRGPYIRGVPVAREIAVSTLMREVARRGLQMSTDRAADLITVPTVALSEGQFGCNLLLRNGVPAYRIEIAAAIIHFVVDGDERSAKITATATSVGPVRQRVRDAGFETCYSTHRFEEELVASLWPKAQ
jgi:hypothetical protein